VDNGDPLLRLDDHAPRGIVDVPGHGVVELDLPTILAG